MISIIYVFSLMLAIIYVLTLDSLYKKMILEDNNQVKIIFENFHFYLNAFTLKSKLVQTEI